MKWFRFRQNNAKGIWIDNIERCIYIEAPTAHIANSVFDNLCSDLRIPVIECSCCGPRWTYAQDDDGLTKEQVLSYYDVDIDNNDNIDIRIIFEKDSHVVFTRR